MYRSTKTFGHDLGISAAFRQWRAQSHCRLIHGYAISVTLVFEADELDYRNWVVDFGSLKDIKQLICNTFDHKLIVASDDPHIEYFREGHALGVLDLVEVHSVGCEKFAKMIYEAVSVWLLDAGYSPRCRLVSAEIKEHGANSAIYIGDCA